MIQAKFGPVVSEEKILIPCKESNAIKPYGRNA
jgi:hypothetical protein